MIAIPRHSSDQTMRIVPRQKQETDMNTEINLLSDEALDVVSGGDKAADLSAEAKQAALVQAREDAAAKKDAQAVAAYNQFLQEAA